MTTTKHTPGPWEVRATGTPAEYEITSGDCLITTVHCHDTESPADAARIVACVNACEGFEDPSALRDLIHAAVTLWEMLDAADDNVPLEHSVGEEIAAAWRALGGAIDKTGGRR